MKILIIIFISLISISSALACSCLPSSVKDSFSESTEVFQGKVNGVQDSGELNYVVFSVSKVWKGDLGSETKVSTAINDGMCGYNFEQGKEYTVFANEKHVSLCSKTVPIVYGQEELSFLNKPNASFDPYPIIAVIIAGIVVVAI